VSGRGEERETQRVEAFSDGVFAFAVTLLVLDLVVPRFDHVASVPEVWSALRQDAPAYVALSITFATIYIVWVVHHGILRRVHHVDGALLYANGLLLFLVSTCAFPTAFLAEFVDQPAGRLAAEVYSAYFLALHLAFNLVLVAVQRVHHRAAHGFSDLEIAAIRRRARFGPLSFLAAMVVASWSAWASVGICAAYWAILAYRGVQHHRRAGI
jgi:uncharacterized membrane protein